MNICNDHGHKDIEKPDMGRNRFSIGFKQAGFPVFKPVPAAGPALLFFCYFAQNP
jgi:hypothetical protein